MRKGLAYRSRYTSMPSFILISSLRTRSLGTVPPGTSRATLVCCLCGESWAVHTIVFNGRVEFIAPWAAPAVAVAVVVAEQVLAAGLLACSHLERLVDGREEIFRQVWHELA